MIELAAAILALLATPGPTNTLLAIAGAERGWRGALRLIPAELAGYLATVIPLTLLGASLLREVPAARTALTLAAAIWVGWLALSMWRVPRGAPDVVSVTPARVALTTLLNPKALVFGLLILPAEDMGRQVVNFAIFAGLVVLVASAWAGLGASVRARDPEAPPGLPTSWRRASALLLAALSLWLAGRVAGLA